MSYQLAQYLLEQRKSSFISDLPPGQFQPPAVLQRALRTSALILCRLQRFSSRRFCLGGYGLLVFSTIEENGLVLSIFISMYPSPVSLS